MVLACSVVFVPDSTKFIVLDLAGEIYLSRFSATRVKGKDTEHGRGFNCQSPA